MHNLFCRALTDLEYEEICEETLNAITEKFEELADSDAVGTDFDVSFSVGFACILCVMTWFKDILQYVHAVTWLTEIASYC